MSDIFDAIGRRFSMASEGAEDQGETAQIEVDEAGAPLTAEETVEGEVIEATEHAEEADEVATEAEQVEQTAEALESFLDASVQARNSGDYWNAQTAEMTERGLRAVMIAAGGSGDFKVRQLAGENFSDRRDAAGSMLAFENAVTDMLKNLWQKLKDMIKRVVRAVRAFFDKHFSAVGMLKKRAEAIKKKAQTQEKSPGKGKVTVGNWASLHIDGKMPVAGTLVSAMECYAAWTKQMDTRSLTSYSDILDKGADAVEDESLTMRDAVDVAGYPAIDFIDRLGVSNYKKGNPPKSVGYDSKIEKAYATEELPGGVIAVHVVPLKSALQAFAAAVANVNDATQLKRALSDARSLFVQAQSKTKEIDSAKEHVRLSSGEVLQLCTAIIEFCEESIRYKNSWERYEKQTDKFLAKMDKVSGAHKPADDANAATNRLRIALASGLAAFVRNVALWQQAVQRRGIATARAALDYSNSSLSTANTN